MKRGILQKRRHAPAHARARLFENFGGPSLPRTVGNLMTGGEGAVTVIFAMTASMTIGRSPWRST